jgi:hypothetical protein
VAVGRFPRRISLYLPQHCIKNKKELIIVRDIDLLPPFQNLRPVDLG